MSYQERKRRKQRNRGVARTDRLLEERNEERPIPRYLTDDADPEIMEAIEGFDRRRSEQERRTSQANPARPARTAIDVSTLWRDK